MAYDKSLVLGVLMLVLIPVTMNYLGSTFAVDTDQVPQGEGDEVFEDVPLPSGFGFLQTTFDGYALFPWWFNLAIILLPILLIFRSVVSL